MISSQELPDKYIEILYKTDCKNSVRQWKIEVDGSVITVNHGLVGGKQTQTVENIINGKNIGKKNETTPEEQALLVAKSKAKIKISSGYSRSKEDIHKDYRAMLANDFKKQNNISYPMFIQPKLDGYRMIYHGPSDTIFSRTGKEFDIIYNTKLHEELKNYRDKILDGELYSHNGSFQDLGVLRKKKIGDSYLNKIQYHIYDIIDDAHFSIRKEKIKESIKQSEFIKIVPTYEVNCIEDIKKIHEFFIEENYEGSILRKNAEYVHGRTSNLLKYKDFDDEEFQVVDFTHEKDTKGDGLLPVIWVCKTVDGRTFNVASKGTRKERHKLYKNGKNYIGRMLTVQFFGKSEENIPRFPKTLRYGESSFTVS